MCQHLSIGKKKTGHRKYYLPKVEIKDLEETKWTNLMNQWETKIISITSVSFKKNSIGQGDDCAVACLLEYSYYKENLKSDCNRVK